jgi:hypothetical protein
MYADSLAGRIPVSDLPRVLRLNGVLDTDAEAIARVRRNLKPGRGVLRALIRLERHTNTDDFLEFGPGVVGCTGAFQMAVAMWKLGAIALAGVGRVAADLSNRGVKPTSITERLRDLVRRAIVDAEEAAEISHRLEHHSIAAPLGSPPDPDPRWVAVWQRRPDRVWTPARFVGE